MDMFTKLNQAKRTYTRHINLLIKNQAFLLTLAKSTDLTTNDLTNLNPTYDFYYNHLDKVREARIYIEQNIDDKEQLNPCMSANFSPEFFHPRPCLT